MFVEHLLCADTFPAQGWRGEQNRQSSLLGWGSPPSGVRSARRGGHRARRPQVGMSDKRKGVCVKGDGEAPGTSECSAGVFSTFETRPEPASPSSCLLPTGTHLHWPPPLPQAPRAARAMHQPAFLPPSHPSPQRRPGLTPADNALPVPEPADPLLASSLRGHLSPCHPVATPPRSHFTSRAPPSSAQCSFSGSLKCCVTGCCVSPASFSLMCTTEVGRWTRHGANTV